MKTAWTSLRTAGRSSYKNGIIQASFIVEFDGVVQGKETFYMNPMHKEIDERALMVHGLTHDDLKSYDLPMEAFKKMVDFFEQYVDYSDRNDKLVIGGYNCLRADVGFLRTFWYDNNNRFFHSYFKNGAVDLIAVSKWLQHEKKMPELMDDKLETLAMFLNIPVPDQRDASVDVTIVRDCAMQMSTLDSAGAVVRGEGGGS